MAEQLGEAVLTISADTRQLESGLQRAKQQAEVLRGTLAQLGVGLSFAGTLAFIGQQIRELDSASAAVRTLGVNSDELGVRLRALSVELGSNVSQIQLTKAAYDVASSGFADAASATQILKASSLGAQGGFAELDDVVRAVTGVLNAYGQSADKATTIVDTFLQTQNDGVITVRQYAAEIGNIASIAAAGGVGLDQLNAAIATATLRGVPVAQTFTGLRQALASIIKPSQQAAELAASLGLQFNVSALQSKGLAGVLADLQQKTGGSADKIAILLGSVEAQAAIQPLLNDKLAKYNELLDRQTKSSGAAAGAAGVNSKTISGGLQQIGNGFSNLATTLDATLTPLFGGFIQSLNIILLKLNQVAANSPQRVQQRQDQAVKIAEQALAQSPNYNVRAFGNVPILAALVAPGGFTVKYDGKTFKGSLGEIREQVVMYLLKKDLADTNKPNGALPSAGGKPASQLPPPPTVSPAELANIQKVSDLELQGLRERLQLTQQLSGLDQASRTILENRLKLNEKLRDVQQTQLQLDREQAKPTGSGAGGPSERDPAKVLELQNKLKAGEIEIATIRINNQQADAAALRTQQDRVRQIGLEAAAAQAKLAATEQQISLEREALATGQQISRTKQLELQNEQAIAAVKRQQAAAQQALQAELARPAGQRDRVVLDDLTVKLAKANADVRQAYADAGLKLVQNARSAADALKGAQQSFNSTARGSFNLLTSELQQQQIAVARQSVANAIGQGLIRGTVEISNTEQLFQVAGVAESLTNANDALKRAMDDNAEATTKLVNKDWNVYVTPSGGGTGGGGGGARLPDPRPVAAQAYGVWGGY